MAIPPAFTSAFRQKNHYVMHHVKFAFAYFASTKYATRLRWISRELSWKSPILWAHYYHCAWQLVWWIHNPQPYIIIAIKIYCDKHVVLCMGLLNVLYITFSDQLLHISSTHALTSIAKFRISHMCSFQCTCFVHLTTQKLHKYYLSVTYCE